MSEHSVIFWREVVEVAERVARDHGLRFSTILPETRKRARHFGECAACKRCEKSTHIREGNCKHKTLRIRIHQLNRPKRALKPRTIWDTLAHELAHCRPDTWEHGPSHRALTKQLVRYIRSLGCDA